jgi:small subunit ribosomal protein S16
VAVKIKLKRLGKIREPYYRVIVADARTKRDGRAIEEIGKYHPKAEPSLIEINSERAQYWLSVGAQPTEPVAVLLKITGDWQKFKGLPGAEGTLRVAGPKADKKEAFTAAAKESLAAKEAKESKSGGRSTKPAREAKDSAPKDSVAKETKDSAPKDTAPKDAKDAAPKDAARKDAAAKDAKEAAAPKDTAPKDAAPKDAAPKDAKDSAAKASKTESAETAVSAAETAVSAGEGGTADAEPGSGA